jgi:hypothetical protein
VLNRDNSRIDPSNVGTQKKMSANREITWSVAPPKYPAAPPSVSAMHHREGGDDEADLHRRAGPVDDAGVVVAAEQVCPEPVLPAGTLQRVLEVTLRRVEALREEQLRRDRHPHEDRDHHDGHAELVVLLQFPPHVAPQRRGRLVDLVDSPAALSTVLVGLLIGAYS